MDFNITITEIALIIWGVVASAIAHQYSQHHETAWLLARLLDDEALRDQMVNANAQFHAARREEK